MLLTNLGDRPWSQIDPQTADVLRPTLPGLIDQILEAIAHQLPALGRDLAGPYGAALRHGIEGALGHFLTLLGADVPAMDEQLTNLYRSFGAREDRHGRTMETLLAAYRRGARESWAHFAQTAVSVELPMPQVIRLAEAIFAYIDELSAASALGFAHAQVARVGHRDVVRQRLAAALLQGEALTAPARVEDLAAEAGWTVPDQLAAAISPLDRTGARVPLVHPDVLVTAVDEELHALIPGDLLRRHTGRTTLLGAATPVFVGTIRPPAQAPTSLGHARAVRQLVAEQILAPGATVTADDHLAILVVHADRGLLADLRARVLAPLDAITDTRRGVMVQTLRAWLTYWGDRGATARELVVHPQTVSYRMIELRRVFGSALDDPAGRFALALALSEGPTGDG